MRPGIVAGLLCTLLVSSPVLAKGIDKGDGEIGFDFGGTNFDSSVSERSGAELAFRGGYHFTRVFQLEGQAAISETEESATTTILSRTMVNAVFNFHPKKETLVPYLLVGVGSATLAVDTPFFGEISDSDLAYQGAFGGRIFFGREGHVAFRFELSVLNEGTFDESSTHTNLTGGFTWRM